MKIYTISAFFPFALALAFTLGDIFIMKIITKHFITNPGLVIMSFLELYLISAVTMIYVLKEKQVANNRHAN